MLYSCMFQIGPIEYRKLGFEEFCVAAVSVHQLEGIESWELLFMALLDNHIGFSIQTFLSTSRQPNIVLKSKKHVSLQMDHRTNFVRLFSQELGLSPSVPVHVVLQDWIRHSDGKLSFLGFVRLLHGLSSRSFQKA